MQIKAIQLNYPNYYDFFYDSNDKFQVILIFCCKLLVWWGRALVLYKEKSYAADADDLAQTDACAGVIIGFVLPRMVVPHPPVPSCGLVG